jgi:hypothetical protein
LCVFGAVIVELKALGELTTREHSQVLNGLKTNDFSRTILLNFGAPRLEYKRFTYSSRPRTSANLWMNLLIFPRINPHQLEVSGG